MTPIREPYDEADTTTGGWQLRRRRATGDLNPQVGCPVVAPDREESHFGAIVEMECRATKREDLVQTMGHGICFYANDPPPDEGVRQPCALCLLGSLA